MFKMTSYYVWQKFVKRIFIPSFSTWQKYVHCEARLSNEENIASSNMSKFSYNSFKWIQDHAKAFPVDGKNITILRTPQEFYETILKKIKTSKERVTLASLYLGTGELEKKLVNELENALSRDVNLLVLLDYNRGFRGNPNSCSMLRPLLSSPSFRSRAEIALFHTPTLRGFRKHIAPDRWNELLGLHHVKVFVFDDSILISGANLSNDYFTNRQDRYLLIDNCKQLSDHVNKIVSTLASFSLQLQHDGQCTLHNSWQIHPFKGDENQFKTEARKRVLDVINASPSSSFESNSDTLIVPLVQLGPLGIFQDEIFTKELLSRTQSPSRIVMTTGYFNLTEDYRNVIFNKCSALFSIVIASPKVSGFYGAKGIAGWVPFVYSYFAHDFYNRIIYEHHEPRITLLEYMKQNWTFHSKGLWLYLPHQKTPSLTLIGSPNFGYRSVRRDLELQFAVVTHNESVGCQLQREQEDILSCSAPVTSSTFECDDHRVPFLVRLIASTCRDLF